MMGPIDKEDIIQILNIVGESEINELHLEMGDMKLVLKKSGLTHAVDQTVPTPGDSVTPTPSEEVGPVFIDQDKDAVKRANVPAENTKEIAARNPSEEESATPIKAPLLGTFYRAPKPGAAPFVVEGQLVTEDDTLCIIEVMKLFNTVKAGVRGHIREVCAHDGELVEFKQTLFMVEEVEEEGTLVEVQN